MESFVPKSVQMIMSTENVGQTALSEFLEQQRSRWEWYLERTLTATGVDINETSLTLNCEKRRENGWITADEECSTGNTTQEAITSFSALLSHNE